MTPRESQNPSGVSHGAGECRGTLWLKNTPELKIAAVHGGPVKSALRVQGFEFASLLDPVIRRRPWTDPKPPGSASSLRRRQPVPSITLQQTAPEERHCCVQSAEPSSRSTWRLPTRRRMRMRTHFFNRGQKSGSERRSWIGQLDDNVYLLDDKNVHHLIWRSIVFNSVAKNVLQQQFNSQRLAWQQARPRC